MTHRYFRENRFLILRRFLTAALFVFTSVFQSTPGLFPKISGIGAMLLLPCGICAGMFETPLAAALFGAFAGTLWDFSSAAADGYNALLLAGMCCAASIAAKYYLRRNLPAALCVNLIGALLYVTLYMLLFIAFQASGGLLSVFCSVYLPAGLYTFALSPLYYFIFRGLNKWETKFLAKRKE